jgi:hypothetical protein
MKIPRQCWTLGRMEQADSRVTARLAAWVLCGGALLTLGACTTTMTPPKPPEVKVRAEGIPYEEGLRYLDTARTTMQTNVESIDQLDRATRIGVGVGVGGAGIAAAFRGPADAVLGFLTLGGLSYTLNQGAVPTAQAAVYSAGLDNLLCIEQAAQRTHGETAYARSALAIKLPRLEGARNQLRADIERATVQAGAAPELRTLIPKAQTPLLVADALIVEVANFRLDRTIGNEIYAGVNLTVAAVNRELRRQTPDINAIAQSDSILKSFVGSHSQLLPKSATTKDAIGDAKVALTQSARADSRVAQWVDTLTADLSALEDAINDTQASLPVKVTASSEAIAACQMGDKAVALDTAGPIRLTPGGEAFNLRAIGNKPLTSGWRGPVPSATQMVVSQPVDGLFSLAAPKDAQPKTYVLYIHQQAPAKDSADIEIIVGDAPAANGAAKGAVDKGAKAGDAKAGTTGALIPPPPKPLGAQFIADRSMLNVGAAVTAMSDPAWQTRVNDMDRCVGISPSTGQVTPRLRAELAKREPVKTSACPVLLVPSPAPNAAPVPAPAPAPIPQPQAQPNAAPVPKSNP